MKTEFDVPAITEHASNLQYQILTCPKDQISAGTMEIGGSLLTIEQVYYEARDSVAVALGFPLHAFREGGFGRETVSAVIGNAMFEKYGVSKDELLERRYNPKTSDK